MSRFQERGIEMQRESITRAEADRNMTRSCSICCSRGLCASCDGCPIAAAHKFVIDTFDLMKEVNASLRAVHAR